MDKDVELAILPPRTSSRPCINACLLHEDDVFTTDDVYPHAGEYVLRPPPPPANRRLSNYYQNLFPWAPRPKYSVDPSLPRGNGPLPHIMEMPEELFSAMWMPLDYDEMRTFARCNKTLWAYFKRILPQKRIDKYKATNAYLQSQLTCSVYDPAYLCWHCWEIQSLESDTGPFHGETGGMFEKIDTYSCQKCADELRGNGAELTKKDWEALAFKEECKVCGKYFDVRFAWVRGRCGTCSFLFACELVMATTLVGSSMYLFVQNALQLHKGGLNAEDETRLKWDFGWVST